MDADLIEDFKDWLINSASDEDVEIVLWRAGLISLEQLKEHQHVSKTVIYKRWKNIVNIIL
jgi:hypothetical protein|tara:strand:- start:770 stop:952 length:183 start_codon:yes stop_codon:yes gene_type:complete